MEKIVRKYGLVLMVCVLFGFLCAFVLKCNNLNKIDNVLSSKSYSYLPKAAQDYVKEVYEKTGKIILTEKNKEENEPYLNPEYIEYLKIGKASEYGYIPNNFTVDHLYKNDELYQKQGDTTTTKSSLPYYNLRDDGYITNIYDQGPDGLCWAFASTTSLESHLAIKSNKQTMNVFSEKQIDYATTFGENAIDTGNNPYLNNNFTILGYYLNEGGNMIRFINSTAIGISPVACKGDCSNNVNYNGDNSITESKYWKYGYGFASKLSPAEVTNMDNTEYSVDEALFFNDLTTDNSSEVDALVNVLKNQIVTNGSLHVGVGAFTNLSIEYTPSSTETALNSNGKNIIYYIPSGWNPEPSTNHAVSIIGWDDNYTHNICLNKNDFEITDATKSGSNYTCNKGTLYTIHGAWILQNSWGPNTEAFIYLPYNSMKSPYNSISKVSEVDFDNSYRATSSSTIIKKGNTKEDLTKVKFFVSSYYRTTNIYYNAATSTITINDGSISNSGTLIKTLTTIYPGLYTIDLTDKNISFDKNITQITLKDETRYSDYGYYSSLHTKNADENDKYIDISEISKTDENILAKCELTNNKCISTPHAIPFNDNNVFIISGTTRNIPSTENLTFKVKNSNNDDVTNLFHFFRNYSVSNYISALISYNNTNVELGDYTIEIFYNDTKYDEMTWNLSKHNNLMAGIGTIQNPHEISTNEELNDIRNHGDNTGIIYGYYELNNDLDLTSDTHDSNGLFYNGNTGWNPINEFAGSFNGNNHVIKGLYINKPSSDVPVGLFGTVYGIDNSISNLILKNAEITGKSDISSLIGMVYGYYGIEVHDISVINGKISSNGNDVGSIIGNIEVDDDSIFNFYNLFNNSSITGTNYVGGFIGYVNKKSSDLLYNITLTDSVNLGNVTGTAQTSGVISIVSGANVVTLKSIITAGKYQNSVAGTLGDVLGESVSNSALTMNNIKYLTRLYGTSVTLPTQNNITNNTTISFSNVVSNNLTSSFNRSSYWTNPFISRIKRIPLLVSAVDHFDFTEPISDFDLAINDTKNIFDLISPNTKEAKNITYIYDSSFLTINSYGVITPIKKGSTTIHVNSLYDGYVDDIVVNIKDTVTITYNSNNTANEISDDIVLIGQTINLKENAFVYKGQSFVSWNTKSDGTGTTYTDKQLITGGIASDITLYAQWSPIEYTIKFNNNDGTGTIPDWKLNYPESGHITLGLGSAFTKTNYTLDSWNTATDGNGIEYSTATTNYSIKFDDIPFDSNHQITLYAQWKKVEYTITFDSNTGTGSMDNQIYTFDDNKAISPNTLTKIGHTFVNWNTASDGTGTAYLNKQVIYLTRNIRLYAQWTPNEQTIQFNANGGTGTMTNQIFYYNISQELSANTFTREHYTFAGWNTKIDKTGTNYSDKKSIKVTSNITLYAQWSPEEYTIQFNSNGGTGTMANEIFTYGVSKYISSNTFQKGGYVFKKWNTASDGTGISYSDAESISISSNITLYAIWQEGVPYTINKYCVEDNNVINRIEHNTTIDQFKNNITLNFGCTVDVESKNINNKLLLYTGGITKIYNRQTVIQEYTNIVTGDVNGNGQIDIIDYIRIMKDIMGTTKLSGVYYKAADVNQNNKIDIIDYIRIMKIIMEEN